MLYALRFLASKDFTGKDIPYMHAKTIEYLLKQKKCAYVELILMKDQCRIIRSRR